MTLPMNRAFERTASAAWPGDTGRSGWPPVPDGFSGSSRGWRLARSGVERATNVSRGAEAGTKLTGASGLKRFTLLLSVLRCSKSGHHGRLTNVVCKQVNQLRAASAHYLSLRCDRSKATTCTLRPQIVAAGQTMANALCM